MVSGKGRRELLMVTGGAGTVVEEEGWCGRRNW